MKKMLYSCAAIAVLGAMTPAERAAGRYLRDGNGHPDTQTAEQMAAAVKQQFQSAIDAVKAIAEDALGKAKSGETMSTSTKEKADEALLKMNALQEQVSQMEQKIARKGSDDDAEPKTLGEQFTESEGVKSWLSGSPTKGKADLRLKATLTSSTANAAGAVGNAIRPHA
jgi:hypothetical protein